MHDHTKHNLRAEILVYSSLNSKSSDVVALVEVRRKDTILIRPNTLSGIPASTSSSAYQQSKSDHLGAVMLWRRANKSTEAARMLATLAEQVASHAVDPLRAKKLQVSGGCMGEWSHFAFACTCSLHLLKISLHFISKFYDYTYVNHDQTSFTTSYPRCWPR